MSSPPNPHHVPPHALPRVAPDELRARLAQGGSKTLVVDVRDLEERTLDGAIKDSHHVPAHVLKSDDAAVDAVLRAATDAGASTVVVHCALSQVRGPACASRLATRLKERGGLADLDVAVLRGGFGAWAESAPEGDAWTERGG